MTGDELRAVTFHERLRGFHPDDVDDALEGMAMRLDRGALGTDEVDAASFRTRLRGYDRDEVRKVLADLRASLG